MEDESFYFSLLRISIAQILKAQGYDKCKPSILNILVDIYLDFFTQLCTETVKCSNLRTQSNQFEIQDITQSMINLGIIKVQNITSVYDDFFEESKYNTRGISSFKNWVVESDQFRNERYMDKIPQSMIKSLIERRKLSPMESNEEILMKKKQKHQQRQQYYNSLKLNNDDNKLMASVLNVDVDDDDEEEKITNKDKMSWFNYLIEKDLKLGHDLKYLNTNKSVLNEFMKFQNNQKFHPIDKNSEKIQGLERIHNHLQNLNKNDYIIIDVNNGVNLNEENQEKQENTSVNLSKELIDSLPYNIKYDDYLIKDLEPDSDSDSELINDGHDHIIPNDDSIHNEKDINNDNVSIDDDGIGGDNNLIFL